MSARSETRALWTFIAVAALIRFGLAAIFGLGYDETYDTVVARSLELSYYDHPPAAMWLIWASTHLLGSEAPFVVRLPTLLLFSAQNLILYLLTKRLFSARAGLYAAAAIGISPLFSNFIGMIALTDGPFIFSLTAAAYFLTRALESEGKPPLRDWGLAGLFLGLATLSKFTAVLSLAGVLLYLLTTPSRRRVLATPAPYVAGLVAFIVFSPVLIWNAQHGWAALAFQGGRAEIVMNFRILRVLRDQSLSTLIVGPAVWLGLLLALIRSFDKRRGLLVWLALTPILFFLFVDLFGTVTEPLHWPAPGYLFLFPLLGEAAARWSEKRPRLVFGLAGAQTALIVVLAVGLSAHMYTGWIAPLAGFPEAHDPLLADEADWSNFADQLEARGLMDPKRYVVVAGRYYFCFKAEFVLRGRLPVVCLDDLPIRKSLTPANADFAQRDAIVIESWWRAPQSVSSLLAGYARVEPQEPIWVTHTGRRVMRIEMSIGRR